MYFISRVSLCAITIVVLHATPSFSQSNHTPAPTKAAAKPDDRAASEDDSSLQILKVVEKMPAFKGDLSGFLGGVLHYPDSARAHNIEGRALVRFVVNEKGKVTRVHIVQSSGNNDLDDEAVRVVKQMPPWTPGRQEGKPVKVMYTLPITFKLDD